MAAKKSPSALPTFPRATDIITAAEAERRKEAASNGADILVADWRRGIPASSGTQVIGSLDEIATRRGGYEVYRKLYDEVDVVKACVTLKVAAIVPGYSIEPVDPNSSRDVEVAEALTEDFENLAGSFERTVSELVTSSLVMGFGVAVKTWFFRPRVRIAAVRPINVSGLDFVCDSANRVLGIRQTRAGNVHEDIDPRHVVHLTHGGLTHNDPFGTSDLKSAWRLCWQRENIMAWWMAFLERYAEPAAVARIPVHYPESKQNAALEALRRIQPKTAITVPSDVELSYLTTQTDPRVMYLAAIDAIDVRIARSLLMPDRLGFSGRAEETGSYALADVQSRLWFIAIENARKHIEQVINEQLVKECVRWGWSEDYARVRFKLAPLTPEDKAATVAQWTQLVSAGVVRSGDEDERKFRRSLGMPLEPENESRELRERHAGVVSLKERVGPGATLHRRSHGMPGSSPSSSPSLFSEEGRKKPQLARPLTHAESRADVLRMAEEEDDEARGFAVMLGDSSAELVADIRGQVERTDYRKNPDAINSLKPSPAVLERIQARIEEQLNHSFAVGQSQGLRAIEAATGTPEDAPSDAGATPGPKT